MSCKAPIGTVSSTSSPIRCRLLPNSCLLNPGRKKHKGKAGRPTLNDPCFAGIFAQFGRPGLGSRLPGTRPAFLFFPRKSIREGASSLFGPGPESPKIVSCSRATPRLHRCKSGVAPEQEIFWGLSGPGPKRLLLEGDKRATTNVQNRFAQLFSLSFLLFCSP